MQSAPMRIQAAVPALVRAMDGEDAETRRIVIDALARIGPPANAAITPLIDAASDEDPDVREAAAQTLEKIRE